MSVGWCGPQVRTSPVDRVIVRRTYHRRAPTLQSLPESPTRQPSSHNTRVSSHRPPDPTTRPDTFPSPARPCTPTATDTPTSPSTAHHFSFPICAHLPHRAPPARAITHQSLPSFPLLLLLCCLLPSSTGSMAAPAPRGVAQHSIRSRASGSRPGVRGAATSYRWGRMGLRRAGARASGAVRMGSRVSF